MAGSWSVVPPACGRTRILNRDPSNFTIEWIGTECEVEFQSFKVVCTACNRILYSTASNPATFNLDDPPNPEGSRHPGPYVIYVYTDGLLWVYTSVCEGRGTTKPAVKEYDAYPGKRVSFSIEATPEKGWELARWSRDCPFYEGESKEVFGKKTKVNGSVLIPKVPPDVEWFVTYYAYFRKKNYNYTVRIEWISAVGGVEGGEFLLGGGYSRLLLLYRNSSGPTSYPIAHVECSRQHGDCRGYVSVDETLTARLVIDDMERWTRYGLEFRGWRLTYIAESGETISYEDTSGERVFSWTLSADQLPKSTGSTNNFYIYAIITCGAYPVVFRCLGCDADMQLCGLTGSSGSWSVDGGSPNLRRVGRRLRAYYKIGQTIGFRLYGLRRPMVFVHGWSLSLSGASDAKRMVFSTPPPAGEDFEVDVYVCSHRLPHSEDPLIVHGGPDDSLLHDCSVPTGSSVYP